MIEAPPTKNSSWTQAKKFIKSNRWNKEKTNKRHKLCFKVHNSFNLIPCGAEANVLNCNMVVSVFETQLCYYIYFRTDTLGKGMNTFISPNNGLNTTTTVIINTWWLFNAKYCLYIYIHKVEELRIYDNIITTNRKYTKHSHVIYGTIYSCFDLIWSHRKCIPWTPPQEIEPAATECKSETLPLGHRSMLHTSDVK